MGESAEPQVPQAAPPEGSGFPEIRQNGWLRYCALALTVILIKRTFLTVGKALPLRYGLSIVSYTLLQWVRFLPF